MTLPRRPTVNVTGIKGTGTVNASEVWRVLQCPTPGCEQMHRVSEDWLGEEEAAERPGELTCPDCSETIPRTAIDAAARWKYCRVCEQLQPLENFHRHKPTGRSFRSGRQLECKTCKNTRINPVLNPLRTSDQHRESAQRRRLYSLLSGDLGKIDSVAVHKKFGGCCFNCEEKLDLILGAVHLDHTLPARYLWPLTTETATLLCPTCNNAKHDQWPSEFYTGPQIKKLAVLTGIDYELLSGPPTLNREAVNELLEDVDQFLEEFIPYPNEIKKIRRLLIDMEGVDIFEHARHVPESLRES